MFQTLRYIPAPSSELKLDARRQGVPESVSFDIEVKMTTPDDLAATPAAEVERMVSATLAIVRPSTLTAHCRRRHLRHWSLCVPVKISKPLDMALDPCLFVNCSALLHSHIQFPHLPAGRTGGCAQRPHHHLLLFRPRRLPVRHSPEGFRVRPDTCRYDAVLRVAKRVHLGLHCSAHAELKPAKHVLTGCSLRRGCLIWRRALRVRQARFAVMFLPGGGAYTHVDARRTSVAGSGCLIWRRALRARQARFAVMFLSGGGAYAHVDARRTSVAGAVDWALQAGLQGLVLEAGAVQAQPDAVASARSKGLLVRAGLINMACEDV